MGESEMIIEINSIPWTVEFVDEEDEDLGTQYVGRTLQWKQRIVVQKKMSYQMIREVLIHELTHATLACQGRYFQNKFSVEDVCEFVGFNADMIIELAEKIMEDYRNGCLKNNSDNIFRNILSNRNSDEH